MYTENCKLISETGGVGSCSTCMLECLDGVLDAKAIEFKDKDWIYPYADIDDLATTGSGVLDYINDINKNKYSNGSLGINRLLRENIYYTNRKQSQKDSVAKKEFKTNIGKDGTYENFCIFDWLNGNEDNIQNNWKWINMPTIYSPYGYELENRNALNIYSSALYGYDNSVAIAVTNNARYYEIASEGFEDYTTDNCYITHGHFVTGSEYEITQTTSHTGKYCLESASGDVSMKTDVMSSNDYDGNTILENNKFLPCKGKEYIILAWVKPPNAYSANRKEYSVGVTFDAGGPFSASISPTINPIDGWYPLKLKFKVPANATTCEITFNMYEDKSYLDDIRIQLASSSMKTYVYDSKTLKLLAELDENNYATFYNYDEEGVLVQMKKETEKGIFTIKTTRQNIKNTVRQ